jgi:hypothetical protein
MMSEIQIQLSSANVMEIKNSNQINGMGVFSTKEYKKNEVIFVLSGKISSKPTRESIHVGNNQHIDDCCRYADHSFDPNISI